MANKQRLQEYGVGIFSDIPTKSALKKALKKDCITVNGAKASTATFIKGGETICYTQSPVKKPRRKLVFPLQVLFEDEHIAAVLKPAGILTSGNGFKTVTNALAQNLNRSTLADACLPQPVHRLDYATTGILLCGKTRSAIRKLNSLFENKEISKSYICVCIGAMPSKGEIKLEVDSKAAISQYTVLQSLNSERFDLLNLVEVHPKTGRRHQIRKHLSSLGNPILGDKDYGKEGLILQGKGMYLHAHSLFFAHPFSNENIKLKAPLPKKYFKIFGEIQSDLQNRL